MSQKKKKKNDGFTLKKLIVSTKKRKPSYGVTKTKNQLSNDIHTINKKIL